MKYLSVVLIFAIIISCQQKKDDHYQLVKDAIHKYFSAKTEGLHLDSVDLYKIDTLTSQKIEEYKALYYVEIGEEVMDNVEERTESLKRIANVYSIIGYDDYSKKQHKEILSKIDKDREAVNKYTELAKLHIARSDSMSNSDFKGYVANYNLIYSDSTSGVQNKLDSVFLILTPSYKVIEKSSLIEN